MPDPASRPRSRRTLRGLLTVALGALVLGPLAAIAAAGSGGAAVTASSGGSGGSGGSGLVTTGTVGTTTAVLTTGATTGANGTTTEATCTTPVLGTVTNPTTTTVTNPTTTTVTGPTSTTATSTVPTATYPVPGTTSTTATSTTATTATTTTTTTTGSSGCTVTPPAPIPTPAGSALAQRGMWIWELPATDGGHLTRIVAQARASHIGTLYVKSGDGTTFWSQFTPTLVRDLHAAGLHVCAWQYVYGQSPVLEAEVGAQAVRDGADCLVIDAETEYQGRYVQAQEYLHSLRVRIGTRYPVALAGLPYVDFHPSFPYSVFLGPSGAQYNLPQMYWLDIETSVDAVYAHTYAFNELYQRPIFPLGQTFDDPSTGSVRRFRAVGIAYRAAAVSWWDWQSSGAAQFRAIAAPTGPIAGYLPDRTVASLSRGAAGDLVVLAQEHLFNTHERVTVDGGFGPKTQAAVSRFQTMHQLPVTGVITPQTWNLLLRTPLPAVTWELRHRQVVAVVTK